LLGREKDKQEQEKAPDPEKNPPPHEPRNPEADALAFPERRPVLLDLSVVNSAPSPSAACTPERSSKARTSVRGLAKPSRIPRPRKSSDNASSIAAPVLSMLLIVLSSTMSHLMPGWVAATSSTRFLKYGALKNISAARQLAFTASKLTSIPRV
jgi:hypothetical protein